MFVPCCHLKNSNKNTFENYLTPLLHLTNEIGVIGNMDLGIKNLTNELKEAVALKCMLTDSLFPAI